MMAHGLPRWICLECPDVVDVRKFGLKSRWGIRVRSAQKRQRRKSLKTAERMRVKKYLHVYF